MSSSPQLVCVSPVDGREYARRPCARPGEAALALAAARAAQRAWVRTSLHERRDALMRFLEAMRALNDDIVPELAWQMGRPVRYGGEFRSFEERLRAILEQAEEALASHVVARPDGIERLVAREPVGLVLVIAPWNYPYLTAINTIAPALLAGNAVVLKHAAQTILVGERFAEAFRKAGLPEGLFTHLPLSHAQVAGLLAERAFDHVAFTGSVEGGRAVERAAAGTFASLTLELGGKDPAYVREDADLAAAVETLVDGAMFNSGQCCCGIERIYVQREVYVPFVEAFADLAGRYVLGDPLDPATTLGPMASLRQADLVRAHVADALGRGAKALIAAGGFAADAPGTAYVMPQVLTEVTHDMAVMTEETFGPVVGIVPVDGDDEAVARMNDARYGLTASIWTADPAVARRLGARVETGTVFMNRCDHVDPFLPWSGVKDTGRGASLGAHGFSAVTRPKAYHLRTPA